MKKAAKVSAAHQHVVAEEFQLLDGARHVRKHLRPLQELQLFPDASLCHIDAKRPVIDASCFQQCGPQ